MRWFISVCQHTHCSGDLGKQKHRSGVWHHGGIIEGPSQTPRASQHYRIEGFEANPQMAPYYAERRQYMSANTRVCSLLH